MRAYKYMSKKKEEEGKKERLLHHRGIAMMFEKRTKSYYKLRFCACKYIRKRKVKRRKSACNWLPNRKPMLTSCMSARKSTDANFFFFFGESYASTLRRIFKTDQTFSKKWKKNGLTTYTFHNLNDLLGWY